MDRLWSGPPLCLDGALGTLLHARGLGWGTERVLAAHPDAVARAHADYVAAGAEAVHTCTFGGNRVRLEAAGLGARLVELNRQAVAVGRAAGARWVLGDVGPTGVALSVSGWNAVFREQIAALEGVDAIHLETFWDLAEARAALTAARAVSPGRPVWVSMTFVADVPRTWKGDALDQVIETLLGEGADAIGVNCTRRSDTLLPLCAQVLERVRGRCPVVMQPNAGQPRQTPAGPVYDQHPADFARDLMEMGRMGARALGGCCGTDPDYIVALSQECAAAPHGPG